MSSELYFTQNKVFRRLAGVDTEIESITKGDYISDAKLKRTLVLVPAVDVVVSNILGNYIVIVDSQNADPDTAHYTLSIDADSLSFSHYLQTLVSGTAISIQSDIAASVEITLIKVS